MYHHSALAYNPAVIKIKRLSIRRFKSIQNLDITCRRVNILVGEPDTGKSNIIEGLRFLSRLGWNLPIDASFRIDHLRGLFYGQFLDKPIEFDLDDGMFHLSVSLQGGNSLQCTINEKEAFGVPFGGTHKYDNLSWLRHYEYAGSAAWGSEASTAGAGLVAPPSGKNLMFVSRHHSEVSEYLRGLVARVGRRLRFNEQKGRYDVSEIRPDIIVDYDFECLSDSVKRLFFYSAVVLTSTDSCLVFDEPDVCAFPPYPKALAEMIADDNANQFILTTHNPYFLSALLSKTPLTDLAVFVTSRAADGSTVVRQVVDDRIGEMIDAGAGVFFDLDSLVDVEPCEGEATSS